MINPADSGLTATEVAARLGVEMSTVYAYVSRGALTRRVGPVGRRSRYDPDEVEALARRSRPRSGRRTSAAVDVVIGTTISEIGDGWIRYRGLDLINLIDDGYEAVAELLWTAERGSTTTVDDRLRRRVRSAVGRTVKSLPPAAPVSSYLVAGAAAAAPLLPAIGVNPEVVGHLLLDALVVALPPVGPAPTGPTLAARLWPRLSALEASAERVRALDTALVLLAEHELATSTLAVRVAASTRAEPAAAVVSGLATVSGALHGRAAVGVHRWLLGDPDTGLASAGFGHVVHRSGDPRFPALREAIEAISTKRHRTRIAELLDLGAATQTPNVDAALGALGYVGGMAPGATEGVFAIARTAGWLAHAFEEYDEKPVRFRGRTLYRGSAGGRALNRSI